MTFARSSRPASTARRRRTGSRRRSSSGGTGSAGRSSPACCRSIASVLARMRLEFDDLAVTLRVQSAACLHHRVVRLRQRQERDPRSDGTGPAVPSSVQALATGAYVAARVSAGNADMNVDGVSPQRSQRVRSRGARTDLAWQGDLDPATAAARRSSRLRRPLRGSARALRHLRQVYNGSRGTQLTSEEVFDRLTISEQTTFYGITHALMNTRLTDMQGASLGLALDRDRVRRTDRGTVRRTQRRRAIPALCHSEAGHT